MFCYVKSVMYIYTCKIMGGTVLVPSHKPTLTLLRTLYSYLLNVDRAIDLSELYAVPSSPPPLL